MLQSPVWECFFLYQNNEPYLLLDPANGPRSFFILSGPGNDQDYFVAATRDEQRKIVYNQ